MPDEGGKTRSPAELKDILRKVDEALAEGKRLRHQIETAIKSARDRDQQDRSGQPQRRRPTRKVR